MINLDYGKHTIVIDHSRLDSNLETYYMTLDLTMTFSEIDK